jgi:peptidoglycan/LPS O-acetylase OafA/YrhL
MSSKVRLDIQVLRAVAVSMVVLFHFWPGHFTGGFAGVDVFFVISGYLITSHLAKQGKIRFAEFWARRARRLLPAAFVVIFVTIVATHVLVSPALVGDYARQAIASVFYSENWVLAANSTNYFADGATPYQHYWSLAVEEQFYIVWPLLIALLLFLKRKLALGIAVLSALSFAYAIYETAVEPSVAYFNPLGRVWEFGLGALIATATLPKLTKRLSASLSLLGFAGLAATIVFFNPTVAFPGAPALLPTLATALVLFAGTSDLPAWMDRRMGFAPVQFVGKISYSLYLWHWPLVILPAFVANGQLSGAAKLILMAVAVLLSWLTKKFVEDPIRFAPALTNAKPRKTLILALVASLLLSGTAAVAMWVGDSNAQADVAYNETLSLAEAKKDASDPGSKCMTKAEDSNVILCDFGKTDSNKRMLLVGDSHAATHLRALTRIATNSGWHLVLAYKAGCSFSLVERNQSARGTSCAAWNKNLEAKLAGEKPFNLVITNNYAANRLADISAPNWNALAVTGFRAAWQPLIDRGAQVVVIRDNPEMTPSMAKCFDNATLDASMCKMPISEALYKDDAVTAAEGVAKVLDLTDVYCPNQVCPAKIGDTYVYRNKDHVSGSFDGQLWRTIGGRLRQLQIDF